MGARLSWTSEGKEISIKSASEVGFTANGGNLNLKSCVCSQVNSCQTTRMHGWIDGTIKSVTLTPTLGSKTVESGGSARTGQSHGSD